MALLPTFLSNLVLGGQPWQGHQGHLQGASVWKGQQSILWTLPKCSFQGGTICHLLPSWWWELEDNGRDDRECWELLPDVEHPIQVRNLATHICLWIMSCVVAKVPCGAPVTMPTALVAISSLMMKTGSKSAGMFLRISPQVLYLLVLKSKAVVVLLQAHRSF